MFIYTIVNVGPSPCIFTEQTWTVIAKDEDEAMSMTRDFIKEHEGSWTGALEVEDIEAFTGSGVISWSAN